MNLFTIITTILELLLAFLSLLAALKSNSTPPQSSTATPTVSSGDSSDSQYAIQLKNQKTLKKWLSLGISITFPLILIFTIAYNWNNIPSTGTTDFPLLNILNNALYLGVGYTTKITIFTIPILSIGIIIKNIKNSSFQFRIFNILTYSLLTLASIWLALIVSRLNYLSFIPTPKVSSDITTIYAFLFNLVHDYAFTISLFQLLLIYLIIQFASDELIFDRQYCNDLEKNARYVCSKILLLLFFIILLGYWTYVWK